MNFVTVSSGFQGRKLRVPFVISALKFHLEIMKWVFRTLRAVIKKIGPGGGGARL